MSAQNLISRAARRTATVMLAAVLAAGPLQLSAQGQGAMLREGAPDSYTVVRGDTLWSIAGRFLSDPWRWPDIWEVNPEIENPHLIYPGDVIRLTYVAGQPRLSVERGVPPPPDRDPRAEQVQPQIRVLPLDEAVPTIPLEVIRPFLSRPRVVSPGELESAPYILQSVDGRLIAGQGNRVYVRGVGADPELEWTVVRQGQLYTDPITGEELGYEAEYVAEGRIDRIGDPATMVITSSNIEAMRGDRLLSLNNQTLDTSLHPRAPNGTVEGHIVARMGGGIQIGQYHVIVINLGQNHGMEPGMVLSIWKKGQEVEDTVNNRRGETVQLPDERAGEAIVFRTFDRVSYALVMRSSRDMDVGDILRNP